MATMDKSKLPQYAHLLKALDALPAKSRVPEIESYVYGQTFEDIQQRLDKLSNSILFADYGEFDMLSHSSIASTLAYTKANMEKKLKTVCLFIRTAYPAGHFCFMEAIYTKQAITVDEQIEVLKHRSLLIEDEVQAKKSLNVISYFRLADQ